MMNGLLRLIFFFLCVYSYGQQYAHEKDSIRLEMNLLTHKSKAIVRIYNNFSHSIIILRNKPDSNYDSSEQLAIHIDNMITDPDIMPNYKQAYYLVKPGEFIEFEKNEVKEITQLKEVTILFTFIHPANLNKKCRRKLQRNIRKNKTEIDLKCIAEYQDNIDTGQVLVKFDLNKV